MCASTSTCTGRVHDRVHGHVYGRYTAVHTNGRVHGRGHNRVRAVHTTVYRTWPVQSSVHGRTRPYTASGRVRAVSTVMYLGRVHGRVHGSVHGRSCTRVLSLHVCGHGPYTAVDTACERPVHHLLVIGSLLNME